MAGFMPLGVNPFDNASQMPPERTQRLDRINPHITAVKTGAVPAISKEQLIQLMTDFKEEGNDNFKEKNYRSAGDLYTCALIVAKMLQVNHAYTAPKELLAVFFSNRAACCQKMDMYDLAITDSESAISLNPSGVKSFYRKAMALKSLRRFDDALAVIREGLERAQVYNKAHDGEELKKLQEEIEAIALVQQGGSRPQGQGLGQGEGQGVVHHVPQQQTLRQDTAAQPATPQPQAAIVSNTAPAPSAAATTGQSKKKAKKGKKKGQSQNQKLTGALAYLQNVQGMTSSSSSGDEDATAPSHAKQQQPQPTVKQAVAHVAHSSSDDDDEFQDANDKQFNNFANHASSPTKTSTQPIPPQPAAPKQGVSGPAAAAPKQPTAAPAAASHKQAASAVAAPRQAAPPAAASKQIAPVQPSASKAPRAVDTPDMSSNKFAALENLDGFTMGGIKDKINNV